MDMDASSFRAKTSRLTGIAKELLAMAQQVERERTALLIEADGTDGSLEDADLADRDGPLCLELARELYRARRKRDKIFGTANLFGEPAWDILLDLFIAAKENRRVSLMSACIGSAAASTTALRWITALERDELVIREDDPQDARRTYVRLSERGYMAMIDFFTASSQSISPTAVVQPMAIERALPKIDPAAMCGRSDTGPVALEHLPALRRRLA